jgi:hypothetical protein
MDQASTTLGAALQQLQPGDQALVLARVLESRSEERTFSPSAIDNLLLEMGIPRPGNISAVLARLQRKRFLTRGKGRGTVWKLTPTGRVRSQEVFTDIDLVALIAETQSVGGPQLAHAVHPVIPPSLAPPELVGPLRDFLSAHPFERNVFGMTRYPDTGSAITETTDPVDAALVIARDVCGKHGLELHLASDRAISDDLWTNVAGHMWASKYGIGFFEDRLGRGVNYNLTLEVGGMLITGRRCALLKDESIKKLPTDLVGRIYREVDLSRLPTVEKALHSWARDDLSLGTCKECG